MTLDIQRAHRPWAWASAGALDSLFRLPGKGARWKYMLAASFGFLATYMTFKPVWRKFANGVVRLLQRRP